MYYRGLLRMLVIVVMMVLMVDRSAVGQARQPDWGFVKFLIDKENYNQALLLLNKFSTTSTSSTDSLNFYLGWTLYNLQDLQRSTEAFRKVSISSSLYIRSGLFGAWNQAYLKDVKMADQWLSSLNGSITDEMTLVRFETLGIRLLERNFSGYQKIRSAVSATHYAWSEALDKMDTYANQLNTYRPKKTVVSGLLSSVIPGLGKIYTGQTGSGISAFLMCGVLGAMTVENGIKAGWGHWSTLVFGSLFTLFYAGNIYGSIISAKEVRDYYNEDMDQGILLDMHLPMREFYR